MAAIQLNFTLRTSANCKTVHLLGSWDGYQGQLPLSKDAKKAGGWVGTFKFPGATLKQGQRYWYYVHLPNPSGTHCLAHSNPSTSLTATTSRTTPPKTTLSSPPPVANSTLSTSPPPRNLPLPPSPPLIANPAASRPPPLPRAAASAPNASSLHGLNVPTKPAK